MAKQSSKKKTKNKKNSKCKNANKKNTNNKSANKKKKPLKGSVISMSAFFANVPPLVFPDVCHFHIDVKTALVVKTEKRNSSQKKEGEFAYVGYCFGGLTKNRKSL